MAAAVPIIAVIAGGVAPAAVGGGLIGIIVATGVAYIATSVGRSIFPTKTASSARAAAAAADSLTATAANRGIAFVVQTATAKEFALAHWLDGGAGGGRLYIRCFDGAGVVRENQAQGVLASGTTMQWDSFSKG